MKITPAIFDNKLVSAGQSTRQGGVSAAPFYSLNLGMSVNDNTDHVKENRKRFFNSLGFSLEQISLSKQVHGREVLLVEKPGIAEGYDAQITNVPGICLAVSVADCVPILIHDPVNHAVAAIHAGWRGTAARIVEATVEEMMKKFGTKTENCQAFIGACITEPNFEVGDEVAEHFMDSHKSFHTEKKKFHVNLKSANAFALEYIGVKRNNIEVAPYCTWEHNDLFFSHRREKGVTGRMMAAIGLKTI